MIVVPAVYLYITKSPKSQLIYFVTDWSSLVVAKMSPWLQVDSENETVRKNAEKVRFILNISLII